MKPFFEGFLMTMKNVNSIKNDSDIINALTSTKPHKIISTTYQVLCLKHREFIIHLSNSFIQSVSQLVHGQYRGKGVVYLPLSS